LEVQENYSNYTNCQQTFCANAQTDEEYSSCIFENCVEEYVTCFYTGEATCDEFYGCLASQNCDANTMSDEQYSECISPCYDDVSSGGFKDAIAWDDCRFGLCNADEDNQADSTQCLVIASYFACFDESGSCLPTDQFVGEGTCQDTANCLTACEDFTTSAPAQLPDGTTVDSYCYETCVEQIDPATSVELGALVTCALTTCGTTIEEVTPQCLADAYSGACATEYAACQ
jgi:hypothetical protein